MCIVFIAYQSHPQYPLLLFANRDEFYQRPTKTAHQWEEGFYAGKDLVAGGTWLGIHPSGRFAALTNYRDGRVKEKKVASRGEIVYQYLHQEISEENYQEWLKENSNSWGGFNLVWGNPNKIYYYGNRQQSLDIQTIQPGIYGLSNHLWNTPWPKVIRGCEKIKSLLAEEQLNIDNAWSILQDKTKAKEEDLPDTGISIELETLFSSIFIESPQYGTRCSTIITWDKKNQINFQEQNYDPQEKIKFNLA